MTYAIYVTVVVVPFLLVRRWDIKVFGLLVAGVLVVTYLFFSYAYIGVLLWRRSDLCLFAGADVAQASLARLFVIARGVQRLQSSPSEEPLPNAGEEFVRAIESSASGARPARARIASIVSGMTIA